jgi:ABC-type amino acid transport substrate-binding protein
MRNYSTRIIIPNHPTRSRLRVAVCILCILISLLPKHVSADQTAPIVVRYPASDSNPHYYKRVKYFVEILELALSKSNHQYQLQKISLPFMNESRSKTNITANLYDVHWLNTQTFLDQDLQPIRIPLCKGLTGWRVFFIRPESQLEFSSIKSADDLKNYTAGNGNDWPEAVLYDHANLPQKLSGSWKGLFYMLKQNRIDYLSRSALEIYDEEDAFPELNLKVESQLIIQYPAAYYFYVSKNNKQLSADIKIGLERAIADGSFDKIFNRYFSEKLKRLDLGNRRIVKITASENTKLLSDQKKHPSYWYTRFSASAL